MNNSRNMESNKTNDFKASGILIKTKINDKQYYFMSFEKKRGLWGDIGGKRDNKDKSILETAIREFNEETNNLFFLDNNDLLAKTSHLIREYCIKEIKIYHSKYLIYLLNIPIQQIPWLKKYNIDYNDSNELINNLRKITKEHFGVIEEQNGLEREISFISDDDFIQMSSKKKINPRLFCKFLQDKKN
jgi:hypothetical protein